MVVCSVQFVMANLLNYVSGVSENDMTNVKGLKLIEDLFNEYYVVEGMFKFLCSFWCFSTA